MENSKGPVLGLNPYGGIYVRLVRESLITLKKWI